ncbi:hypothetical protein F5878DRAFT_510044, partial [Lentinula raphanica]
ITRIINHLSTKLELGSPMISLYLLQNPDHYTSHVFVPFYWKSFVSKAQSYWQSDSTTESQSKVVLIQRKGKLIGLSSTFDYTHRPHNLNHYNLYNWIIEFSRVRKRKPYSAQKNKHSDVYDAQIPDLYDDTTQYQDKHFQFLEDHPLYETHVPVRRSKHEHIVPNFLGGILPRPDKDDREYYCCTMLVLFCPWRTGKDLKSDQQTWHEAFETYQFSAQCRFYIQNMNIRYEALDARDDFRAQMKAGNISLASLPAFMHSDLNNSLPSELLQHASHDDDLGDNDIVVLYDPETGMKKGPYFERRQHAMNTMKNILINVGWLD